MGEGGFAGAWGAVEDDGGEAVGLDGAAEEFAWGEDVLLSGDLVERLGAHSRGEGLVRGCGGRLGGGGRKEVGHGVMLRLGGGATKEKICFENGGREKPHKTGRFVGFGSCVVTTRNLDYARRRRRSARAPRPPRRATEGSGTTNVSVRSGTSLIVVASPPPIRSV